MLYTARRGGTSLSRKAKGVVLPRSATPFAFRLRDVPPKHEVISSQILNPARRRSGRTV